MRVILFTAVIAFPILNLQAGDKKLNSAYLTPNTVNLRLKPVEIKQNEILRKCLNFKTSVRFELGGGLGLVLSVK